MRHNDSTSVFYGASAFVQAYNAATHGDIITLSDGIFTTPRENSNSYGVIRKGITVRGNGAVADTARHSTGTYFMENLRVYSLGDSLQFSAEGIYFANLIISSYDIKLTRCYINNFESQGGVQATNCIVKGSVYGTLSRYNTYINCVINYNNNYYLPHYVICNNCIISGNDYYSHSFYQFNNCVVRKSGGNDTILNGAVNNSVLIGFTRSDNPASSVNVAMSLSDVFENWDGESLPTDLETYVLKSSVSDSIQGLDGTEVGIFGGFMPFEWRPSYSIIKRFNVANRTTADGKLSVDIEVISE